jgi:geranylgeranyl diphosphate synthase type II
MAEDIDEYSLPAGLDMTTRSNVKNTTRGEAVFARLQQAAEPVNRTLRELLSSREIPNELKGVLRYTLESPGKRVRAVLVLWCCELLAGKINRNAEMAAAAIEMIHTSSLVHDDLPSMDDDDFRRGRPSCHKAFDEATAILAGDALLTLAFDILATEIDSPRIAVRLIRQLAEDAGAGGMMAGQMADLKAENSKGTEELLHYIHTNKTAKMFRCAAVMGGICGGADESQMGQLAEYGLKIGLGFQIADDILDVVGSSEHLGKTAGKDERADKCTYPAVVGIEKSRQRARQLADEAAAALQPFGPKAQKLRDLAMALLQRTK